MRLLHTSDWHLGRSFHGQDLLSAQEAFLDHLVAVVVERRVDVVLVAGDVYDRALPPVDAVALADRGLHALAATGARVVVSSGNHDSARRLGFGSRLLDVAGVHLRADLDRVGEPVVLHDEHGPVVVHPLPYLDPDVTRSAWGLGARSHEAALGEAMARVRADLQARRSADGRTRSVVTAHAFVSGGVPTDSERDIAVGGVSAVPLALFDGIDYVALGHLHTRARLSPTVRYSGAPLAYSFGESGHVKGSWLVDLGPDGVEAEEFVAAPCPRPLARLRGPIDALLTDVAHERHEQSWLEVTLTDAERPPRAMDRLRVRFPHVLALRFAPEGSAPISPTPARAGRDALEVALDFVAHVRQGPASPTEHALLREALTCCPDDRDLALERALTSQERP